MSAHQINAALELHKTKQTFNILSSNAIKMEGVKEGLDWLAQELKKKEK